MDAKKSLDFLLIKSYDGQHLIRLDLIKSISQCEKRFCVNHVPIDIKSKIKYDNDDVFYFTEDILTIAKYIKNATVKMEV